MFLQNEFTDGIISGLIQNNPDTSLNFQPSLVMNDYKSGRKTLEFILDNIKSCDSFIMAVAFVTRSGVACLHQSLKEFGDSGREGVILVSTYLNFSDPSAIKALSNFQGIQVSFVDEQNFHGKTYLFEHQNYAKLMVGSSNLTQNALGKNTEVNLSISARRESNLYLQTKVQLDAWTSRADQVSQENLERYEKYWRDAKNKIKNTLPYNLPEEILSEFNQREETETPNSLIQPNKMQVPALSQLSKVRENGSTRSLIISATGTGKTVLSALDVKQFGAMRLLFVVHRLNIAKKALSEFKRVFGTQRSMGVYSASDDLNQNADFIFCTVQTINTDRHLKRFKPDEFDYVIIDETHRAGAATYKRVLDYFRPKFLLGMTATPERTDGFDIFSLFNHSIAYEIRLQKAMEADLLAPFHYFGVTDLSVDGIPLDEKSDFRKLISQDRIEHMIKNITEYGCDTGNVRGLIFCSRIEEARELSAAFNLRGFRTVSITGSDSEQDRETAIQRLESANNDKLDYLFTVDVFNEGVDIPQINQVVMLRPTTSAIIFVQQLGRGLRKAVGKDYLTVIDFIGNYQNNYLIPLALFGDSSYNKDRLRRLLGAGSSLIPGASSISFDKISRDRVFASIDTAKLNTKKGLTQDFDLLKFRIGRNPMMLDFIKYEARDPYQYVDYSGSLLAFTAAKSKFEVSTEHLKLIEFLSKHVCDGVRLEEAVILKQLVLKESTQLDLIEKEIFRIANFITSVSTLESSIHNLNFHFATERESGKILRISEVFNFKVIDYDEKSQKVSRGQSLADHLSVENTRRYILDLAEASIEKFLSSFNSSQFVDGFLRGSKYSRKDVFRVLKWDKLPLAQNVGGYMISPDKTNCPIFLTYNKQDNISETTKYEDQFLNPRHLIYMSKSRRTLSSPDVISMQNHQNLNMRLPLFIKKSDDEGLDFYYMGDLQAITEKFNESKMKTEDGLNVSVVKMEFMLDQPVDYRLYKYLTET